MNKILLLLICFLISIHFSMFGQIDNKIDILVNYKSNIYNSFPSEFRNSDGVLIPTILGDLEKNQAFNFGILYSDLSFKYQPGIVIGFNSYRVNSKVNNMYHKLKFSSTSIGFINKFNLIKNDHFIVAPFIKTNIYLNLFKVKADETLYTSIEQTDNIYTTYAVDLRIPSINKFSLAPSFEVSFGTETKLTDRVSFTLELAFSLTKNPLVDKKSPTLYREANILVGLQYKIFKNKRFYY